MGNKPTKISGYAAIAIIIAAIVFFAAVYTDSTPTPEQTHG